MARFIITVDFHARSGRKFVHEADETDTLKMVSLDLINGDIWDLRKAYEFDTDTGATKDVTAELIDCAVTAGLEDHWVFFEQVPAWFVDKGHVTRADFPAKAYGDHNAQHRLTAAQLGVGRFA